jgi:hypothetical protein
VTSDRARKKAIRDRMATGEPYAEAARNLGMTPGADAAADVRAAVTQTMAEPGCRLTLREDWAKEPPAPRGPLLAAVAEASRITARAIRDLVPRSLVDKLGHPYVTTGFAAPATGRYLISKPTIGEVGTGDCCYRGKPGEPLAEAFSGPLVPSNSPLFLLTLLTGFSHADLEGEEVVQGTRCRKYRVRLAARPVGLHTEELTAWLDGTLVRQVRAVVEARDYSTSALGTVTLGRRSWTTHTLELQDFGVSLDELDWSRLPSRPDTGANPASGQ